MRRIGWVAVGLLIIVLAGGIAFFQTGSSPIVSFVTVGQDPWPLAIDEWTSRAFVYNRTDGTVSTINTVTGALVRTVAAGSQFAFMAVDQRTHRLFVSSGDNHVYMLDTRNGLVLRQITDSSTTSPRHVVVDERSNHVFVGHRDSTLVTMLDARSGATLREIPACGGSFIMAASARTGHIFAKCNDGYTDMLDARTGRVLRQVATPSMWGWGVVDERTDRFFAGGDSPPRVDVLDARTGAHVATIKNVNCPGVPTVDEQTGHVFVSLITQSNPNGNGYVAPRQPEVLMLDGWTGAVLRRLIVADNPNPVVVDDKTGHILVASAGPVNTANDPTGYGVLSVLDGTTGRVLRTVPLGVNPADMGVDARSGRVLVANETVNLSNSLQTGLSATLTTSPPETAWARRRCQMLDSVKRLVPGWLPFRVTVPPRPSPPTKGTVTTLDLARL